MEEMVNIRRQARKRLMRHNQLRSWKAFKKANKRQKEKGLPFFEYQAVQEEFVINDSVRPQRVE